MSSTDTAIAELVAAVRELAKASRAKPGRFFALAPTAEEPSYFTGRTEATHGRMPLAPLTYSDGAGIAAALAAMWKAEGLAELGELGPHVAEAADRLRAAAAAAEQDADVSRFIYAMF